MVVTMKDILNLRWFYTEIKDQTLSIRTAYKFTKLFNQVDTELEFYQEQIQQISQEFGELDEEGSLIPMDDGQSIKIKPDKIIECNEKVSELLNLEVNIDDCTFTLNELEGVSLSVSQMQAISKFICE